MNASKIIWQIVFAKYGNEWFNVAQIGFICRVGTKNLSESIMYYSIFFCRT